MVVRVTKIASLFWILLIAILLVGAVPRILTLDYGLPYIEYIDELMLYLIGQRERGIEVTGNIRGMHYPPAFVKMNVAAQELMEMQGQNGPVPTIRALRMLAFIVNLAGLAWVALLARQIAGNVAGYVAALGLALTTALLEASVHAIGESFVYPLVVLSMLCAVLGLRFPRQWYWPVLSLLVSFCVVLFEYRLIVLLLPGVVVLLVNWGRSREFGRRQWLVLSLGSVIGCAVLGGAAFLVGRQVLPSQLIRPLEAALSEYLWDFSTAFYYVRAAIEPVTLEVFVLICAVGAIAYLIAQRRSLPRVSLNLSALALVVLMIIGIPWFASAIRVYGNEEHEILMRHVLPAIGLVWVVMGAAVAQIVRMFPARWMQLAAGIALTAVVIFPQIQPTVTLVRDRMVDPWPVVVREWVDTHLTPGTIIVYSVSERWFNPLWGGIPHRHWFDWWETEDITEYSLEEWIEQRGMSYAAVPVAEHRNLQASEEGQAYLSQMLPLRAFVHPPVRREAEVIFYRLWRMQYETDVHFGDHIVLTGYDQSAETVQPGESVTLTFYWNAPTPPEDNYSLFVHLVPQDEYEVLAQADGAPAVPERPTLTWHEPSETLISPAFSLTIPPDLEPGRYRLMIGLYNFRTGQRLPVSEAEGRAVDDAYQLAELRVTS